jgi:hypothetical protein
MSRMRDSVVLSLTERLDGLAEAPGLTREELDAALAPLQNRLTILSAGGPTVERLQAVDGRLQALELSLAHVAERLMSVGDAAGGIPALATDLHRLTEQVDGLTALGGQVDGVRSQLSAITEGPASVRAQLAGLDQDVAALDRKLTGFAVPSTEEISAAVAARLADRLVDELAPRVADVVLDRIGPVVAQQVGATVAASVLDGVQTSTDQAEVRLRTHMDEAILTLAEALLRKRRPNRSWAPAVAVDDLGDDDEEGEPVAPAAPAASSGITTAPAPAIRVDRELPTAAAPPTPPAPPAETVDEPIAQSALPEVDEDDEEDEDDEVVLDLDEAQYDEEPEPPSPPAPPAHQPMPAPPARPTARIPRGNILPAEPVRGRAAVVEDDDEDEDGDDTRRRPWWRPGG